LPWLLLTGACRHEERAVPATQPKPSPAALSSQPAPSSTPSSAAAAPTPSSSPSDPSDEAASAVVRAWNDALDRHDTTRLDALYGDAIRFYGRGLKKAAVIAAKAAALRQQVTFHQQIVGPLALTHASDGTLTVNFMKRSGEHGKLHDTDALLVLARRNGGSWLIVAEGDAVKTRDAATLEACQAKAAEVVAALPEVKRAEASAMAEADQSKGSARFGGMGPNDDGDGGFSVASGLQTDESFQCRVSYTVDRKGLLSVTVSGSDAAIPDAALKAVEQACKP
jgi:ketosteroid isomerase-like protein